MLVGVLVDAAERRQVEGVGTGDAGGVERRRGVMDGHDRRPESMRLARDAERPPEGIVQDHDVGPHRSERLPQRPTAERQPVSVRCGELQRGELVTSARVEPALAGDHEVVLERARDPGEPGLLVEVGADPSASLRVEEGDVAHHEPVAVGVSRGGRSVHGEYCLSCPYGIV